MVFIEDPTWSKAFWKHVENILFTKICTYPKDGKVLSHHRLGIFERFKGYRKKDDLRLVVGVVSWCFPCIYGTYSMHIHARTRKCGFSDLVLLEVRPSETQLVRIEIFWDAEDPRYISFHSWLFHFYENWALRSFFKLHCRKEKKGRFQNSKSFKNRTLHVITAFGPLRTSHPWDPGPGGGGAFQRQHGVATQSLEPTRSSELLVGKMVGFWKSFEIERCWFFYGTECNITSEFEICF